MSARDAASPNIDTLKRRLRAELPRLREKYAVERLAIHGSRLRGEAHSGSDLDVLVDFKDSEAGRSITLFDFLALQHELEELLGIPVDLGEASALEGPAADEIRQDAEYV